MDDCNSAVRALGREVQARSDSSMDDCNRMPLKLADVLTAVQIPLWTIVTDFDGGEADGVERSDSSMDDCNQTAQGAGSAVT